MRHGSLFSGIGGFDLAAEWMGWENVFHCEWNEFGQKVLKYYWPKAETFTDITKSDFTKYANTIDILTGGFPCQPYSTAGKRKGKEDERHLWPEMLRAIREISPRWIVGENVRGLTNWNGGVVFDEVQADLEAEGYEVIPFLLPACAVNAPHRRDRIWFVAHTVSNGHGNGFKKSGRKEKEEQGTEQRQERNEVFGQWDGGNTERAFIEGDVTDTGGIELQNGPQNSIPPDRTKDGTGLDYWAERHGDTWATSNAGGTELEGSKQHRSTRGKGQAEKEGRQFSGSICSTWQDFPIESPLCTGNDGFSERLDREAILFSKWRNESIKAAGNAIVPQVAYEIFKAIQAYENRG